MNSRLNLARTHIDTALVQDRRGVMTHFGVWKWAALGAALAAALAVAPSASAHGRMGHGAYRGGYSGHYVQPRYYSHGGYNRGGYYRGGHWDGGRWVAGAIVAGAMIGLVNAAVSPPPVVYGPPVGYRSDYPPPVTRRVVESRTVIYEDPYQTRYLRSDW